jgi:hypothetical protein
MVATLSAVILAGRRRRLPCSGFSGLQVRATGGANTWRTWSRIVVVVLSLGLVVVVVVRHGGRQGGRSQPMGGGACRHETPEPPTQQIPALFAVALGGLIGTDALCIRKPPTKALRSITQTEDPGDPPSQLCTIHILHVR